ncbi:MAG: hypothetical protein ACRCZ9_08520 [Fusobacteriaceae bacterium]
MSYGLLFLLVAIFYFIFGIISPVIRNILNIKHGMKVENNIGGFIAKKIYNKKK